VEGRDGDGNLFSRVIGHTHIFDIFVSSWSCGGHVTNGNRSDVIGFRESAAVRLFGIFVRISPRKDVVLLICSDFRSANVRPIHTLTLMNLETTIIWRQMALLPSLK